MKRVIRTRAVDELEQLRARGKVLVDELTTLEHLATALLQITEDDEEEATLRDHVVDCVWNGSTVAELLTTLGVRVR